MNKHNDEFQLYDLRVEVIKCRKGKKMACNHKLGDYFEVSGENLSLPKNQTFPIYPLAALLPFIPAKQRMMHENDWLTTDANIACPDPNCGGVFKISRIRKRTFRHSEVTIEPQKNRV